MNLDLISTPLSGNIGLVYRIVAAFKDFNAELVCYF